jgi:hypothetical protein
MMPPLSRPGGRQPTSLTQKARREAGLFDKVRAFAGEVETGSPSGNATNQEDRALL